MRHDPGLTPTELDELEQVILFEISQPALDAGRIIEGEAYIRIAELLHKKRLAAIEAYEAATLLKH